MGLINLVFVLNNNNIISNKTLFISNVYKIRTIAGVIVSSIQKSASCYSWTTFQSLVSKIKLKVRIKNFKNSYSRVHFCIFDFIFKFSEVTYYVDLALVHFYTGQFSKFHRVHSSSNIHLTF